MTQHMRPEVARRLARIAGHVRAIGTMVESERTYPEIVQQISAVQSSLDSVVEVIVEDLVEGCIKASKAEGRENALQLKEVIARTR